MFRRKVTKPKALNTNTMERAALSLLCILASVIRDLTEYLGVEDAPMYNKIENVTILVNL